METFKRIATILGVAVMGFVGYYVFYLIYNVLQFLLTGPKTGQTDIALLTGIIAAIIYTIKTRRQ
jgi:riboflavin transporter FmnP